MAEQKISTAFSRFFEAFSPKKWCRNFFHFNEGAQNNN